MEFGTYEESIDRFVHGARQLWGVSDPTSISLDVGESLVIQPRGDGVLFSLWSYSWIDDPETDPGIDKLPILYRPSGKMLFTPQDQLHPVDYEFRLLTINRAAGMVTQLCRERNHSIAA